MNNLEVHGIVMTSDMLVGETIDIAGVDVKDGVRLVVLPDNRLMGYFSWRNIRTILTQADCYSDSDRALFDVARGRPFIRASAVLIDENLIKLFETNPRDITWSAEGWSHCKTADGTITRSVIDRLKIDLNKSSYRIFRGFDP